MAVAVSAAVKFHHKKDLESLQIAKSVSELMGLLIFCGLHEVLGSQLCQAYGNIFNATSI